MAQATGPLNESRQALTILCIAGGGSQISRSLSLSTEDRHFGSAVSGQSPVATGQKIVVGHPPLYWDSQLLSVKCQLLTSLVDLTIPWEYRVFDRKTGVLKTGLPTTFGGG